MDRDSVALGGAFALACMAACGSDDVAGGQDSTDTGATESADATISTTQHVDEASVTLDTSTGAGTSGDTTTGDTTTLPTTGETTGETGDTTTGAESTTTTGTGTTTADDDTSGTSEGGDTDTGGSQGTCVDACETGCTDRVLWSHRGEVATRHAGARIATRDESGRLALWNADDAGRIADWTGVGWFDVAGDTLAFATADGIEIVSAIDGAALGTIASTGLQGLARDGSWVWTADAVALRVHELDGTERWSVAGDHEGAEVLALSDALHVFAPQAALQQVVRHEAADGTASAIDFAGDFGAWFADVPRFWTDEGEAYRLYDTDGTQLIFAIGQPQYGFATRMVLAGDFFDSHIVDIADPDAVLSDLGFDWQASDGAILEDDGPIDGVSLVRLDVDPITVTPIAPACCVIDTEVWTFAYRDGHWVVGGHEGSAADELGRLFTPGELRFVAGARSGRAAVATSRDTTYAWDVAQDCTITAHDPFARSSTAFWIAGDGGILVAHERWAVMPGNIRPGTRLYTLPAGALVAETEQGISSDFMLGASISDDGTLFGRAWLNMSLRFWQLRDWPALAVVQSGDGDLVPAIAPDALHIAVPDGLSGVFDTYADAQSYVFDPLDLVALVDGIAYGFLDESHMLVSHYSNTGQCGLPTSDCDVFEFSEIVDLDGVVVQATPLPEIRDFERISATEILARDTGIVWDAYTGDLLWQPPAGAQAAVAGPDHVLVTDGAVVDIVRWR